MRTASRTLAGSPRTGDWLAGRLGAAWRDVRYAARTLRGSPGFAATAILSLALGVGANTAIFSILHALVLRDLPIANPQELFIVSRNNVSLQYPWFRYLRERNKTLAGVVAFRTTSSRLELGGTTERVTSALVSGNYFDVLGVKFAAGSGVSDADDAVPGSGGERGPVAVVSYAAWQGRFGGQPSLIGAQVRINGQPFTVVGITARGFRGTEVGESAEVFLPMMMQGLVMPGLGSALTMPRSNWLRVIGRLRTGVEVSQAEAELTSLQRAYNQELIIDAGAVDEPARRALLQQRITLLPGSGGLSSLRQEYSRPVGVLMALIGIVLLIACANIANLFLGRAASRRREIAIRLGLGASRARIVAQMFTEAVLVAAAGTGAGLGTRALASRLPADLSARDAAPRRDAGSSRAVVHADGFDCRGSSLRPSAGVAECACRRRPGAERR